MRKSARLKKIIAHHGLEAKDFVIFDDRQSEINSFIGMPNVRAIRATTDIDDSQCYDDAVAEIQAFDEAPLLIKRQFRQVMTELSSIADGKDQLKHGAFWAKALSKNESLPKLSLHVDNTP